MDLGMKVDTLEDFKKYLERGNHAKVDDGWARELYAYVTKYEAHPNRKRFLQIPFLIRSAFTAGIEARKISFEEEGKKIYEEIDLEFD